METIGDSTTGTMDNMYVMKTLDGLDLTDDVMHNAAGIETTHANCKFTGTGTNKVYKKMEIGNNMIGDYNFVDDLHSHHYCPDSGLYYAGQKA